MSVSTAKRFYEQAVTAKGEDGLWLVKLDERTLKTPTGKTLSTPAKAIADRIRDEWNAQTNEIRPDTMPLTRLINVALERADSAAELIADIRAYGSTDLLSYRRDEPSDFVARQSAAFDPVVSWAAAHGLPLRTTTGILAIDQDPLTLDRLAAHAGEYDFLSLTMFAHLTATYGSAILALYTLQDGMDAGEAYDLSRIDEIYRAEIWGEDEDDVIRAAKVRSDVVAMAAILPELDIPTLAKADAV